MESLILLIPGQRTHQVKPLHVVGGKVDDVASGHISQCHLAHGRYLERGGSLNYVFSVVPNTVGFTSTHNRPRKLFQILLGRKGCKA